MQNKFRFYAKRFANLYLAYGKPVVTTLVQKYSQWQLAEKSWSDFNVPDE